MVSFLVIRQFFRRYNDDGCQGIDSSVEMTGQELIGAIEMVNAAV